MVGNLQAGRDEGQIELGEALRGGMSGLGDRISEARAEERVDSSVREGLEGIASEIERLHDRQQRMEEAAASADEGLMRKLRTYEDKSICSRGCERAPVASRIGAPQSSPT